MKLDEQYLSSWLSILLSQKYHIRWKATKYWHESKVQQKHILKNYRPLSNVILACTLFELGHLIPFGFFNEMKIQKYLNTYFKVLIDDKWETYETEVDCRGRYLVWLMESGKVTISDIKSSDIATIAKDLHIPLNP